MFTCIPLSVACEQRALAADHRGHSQVEAEITQLQALIVDLAVSKDGVAVAAGEAASVAAGLAQPAPEPEASSSSDDVSEVQF